MAIAVLLATLHLEVVESQVKIVCSDLREMECLLIIQQVRLVEQYMVHVCLYLMETLNSYITLPIVGMEHLQVVVESIHQEAALSSTETVGSLTMQPILVVLSVQ